MKKVFNRLCNTENEIKELLSKAGIKPLWLIAAAAWVSAGTYAYNEFLTNRTVVTKLLFLLISLILCWQNKALLKPFFRNPFIHTGRPYSVSNVLWIYPFSVLMISVVFVIVPEVFGWISKDPQNINHMSMTLNEYFKNLLTLPLLVFEEESINVLFLGVISCVFSKKLKHGWSIAAVLVSACIFGALHISAWGLEAALSRMFIHIPFIFSILFFKSAWISILAHFYQNAMTYTSVIYPDFSQMFAGYGCLLCIAIWSYRRIVNRLKTKTVFTETQGPGQDNS